MRHSQVAKCCLLYFVEDAHECMLQGLLMRLQSAKTTCDIRSILLSVLIPGNGAGNFAVVVVIVLDMDLTSSLVYNPTDQDGLLSLKHQPNSQFLCHYACNNYLFLQVEPHHQFGEILGNYS